MALVKVKPTSPGRRGVVKVVNANLHKGRPHDSLIEKKSKTAGRNTHGHITTRHMGGGHKQHYRVVDFRRDKDGIPGKVENLQYYPNRSANIAFIPSIPAPSAPQHQQTNARRLRRLPDKQNPSKLTTPHQFWVLPGPLFHLYPTTAAQ